MRKGNRKLLAWVLSAALVGSGATATVLAVNGGNDTEQREAPTGESDVVTTGDTESGSLTPAKQETVYVIAGADGSVKKLIVSSWLKNPAGASQLTDRSDLTGIENVKGDESATTGTDGTLVWDADGKDIYYQGQIDRELPVGLSIRYTLDGKEIDAAQLAGQSGRVTMTVRYDNRVWRTVEIDGREERVCVPFAMLTGVLLDNDVFRNVQVDGGRLINDGDRIAVVGVAFPGVAESLGLSEELGDRLPETLTITADVEKFALAGTVSIATDEIFRQVDTEQLQSLQTLPEKIAALGDGVKQLLDGSSALYDGLCTLLERSEELVAGIRQLADGAGKLKDGSAALAQGSAALAGGAGELQQGLDTLVGNNEQLTAGARTVFETLLATADAQLRAGGLTELPALTVENYRTVLGGVIASLTEEGIREQARATVTAQVEAHRPEVLANVRAQVRAQALAQVSAAVRVNVKSGVLAAMGMTLESYEAGVADGSVTAEQQSAVENAVEAKMASEEIQTAITARTEEIMSDPETEALIEKETADYLASQVEANMNSETVQAQIAEAVAMAAPSLAKLQGLSAQLESYQTFYDGLKAYTSSVADAAAGAAQVRDGAEELKAGSAALDAGVSELLAGILSMKDATPALISGVEQLRDGARQLNDGLTQAWEEGLADLTEAVDPDRMAQLLTRAQAMLDAARDYDSFSGVAEGTEGHVNFIYRTDSVKG